ncbi:hypothetical protein AMECASPLE_036943 [Ameca splendens]|uniref:Uncharacterized protein n=1 Tax=Ameca splendens TaxID=208324 RepID=A0ABV0XKZ7_9TELE
MLHLTFKLTSIHPFSIPLLPYWVTGELVPISSSQWLRGGVQPGEVACPSQGNTQDKQPCTHPFIAKGDIERPINLTVMCSDCGKKPEYPERTHSCKGRTCKLHAERPPAGSRTEDLAAMQQCYQRAAPLN